MTAGAVSTVLYQPTAGDLHYTFGDSSAFVSRGVALQPGQVLTTWTEDCFGGAVRTAADLPSQVCEWPYFNPVTGPFIVAGAEPGDTLAVHFHRLTPARGVGVSSTFPHFGALVGTDRTAMLHESLSEQVWFYDLDKSTEEVLFRTRHGAYEVPLPMRPMLGTVGVAPAGGEVRASVTCDAHGGNLDVPAIAPGATVYLGVNVPGARLAFGDGHARQSDGEVSGVAVECAMDVVVSVDVIKGQSTPWPRIETDTHITSVGVARPLEDAYRMALVDLVTWVGELTNLDAMDAYQLVAQAARSRPGNVVNPNYTMASSFDKRYLLFGTGAPYGGAHDRLRQLSSTGDRGGGVGPS